MVVTGEEAATVEAAVLIGAHTVVVIVALTRAEVAVVVVATLHTTMIPAMPAVVPDTVIETELKNPTRNLIDL